MISRVGYKKLQMRTVLNYLNPSLILYLFTRHSPEHVATMSLPNLHNSSHCFTTLIYLCMWVGIYVEVRSPLRETVLSFHHVTLRNQTQVVRVAEASPC